jgi:type IV pilus assembly protein PilY1
MTTPHEWSNLLSSVSLLNPSILYDPGKPVITAGTVGTDGIDYWVYFGTGRFFDALDKTDDSSNLPQTFYGIREPVGCASGYQGLNWLTVTNVTPSIIPTASGTARGNIGLLPVEDIAIKLDSGALESTDGVVGCYDSNNDFDPVINNCIGDGNDLDSHPLEDNGNFGNLIDFVTGDYVYCSNATGAASPSPGFDGWSRDMKHYKERNLGQSTLLGGLLSYSSYIPNTNVCNPEGKGYLYGVYYQTGTSWFKDVFGRTPITDYEGKPIEPSVYMGEGLSTTPNIHVGQEEGGKAFIQTSVGQIVEIPQPNLPTAGVKSGRIKWYDVE